MSKKLRVLSLFDGISCARVALERAGIPVETYFASEIDKYAKEIAQKNYSDTIQIGDVKELGELPDNMFLKQINGTIDLLIGGSPCQDLSIAKKNREGLKGKRSGLFYEYLRILKETRPKYFVLENVASMPKAARDEISKELGVEPIMINATLVSAQQRKRLFWTNIKGVELPEDRGILLKDIIHELRGEPVDDKYFVSAETSIRPRTIKNIKNGNQKANCLSATMYKGSQSNGMTCIRVGEIGKGGQGDRIYSIEGKSVALSANGGGRGAKTGLYLIAGCASRTYPRIKTLVRKLTPIECERLQSLPDSYTEGLSNTQRYKALGNAFNVEVVKHILKNM